MSSQRDVDVARILNLVYRRPTADLDQVTARVRARLALSATLGECARLLFEAPWFALSQSFARVGSGDQDAAAPPTAAPERKAE